MFRKNIAGLLDRTQTLKVPGFEAQAPALPAQHTPKLITETTSAEPTVASADIVKPISATPYPELEKREKADLEAHLAKIPDEAARREEERRLLLACMVNLDFGRQYVNIFGSQIRALQLMSGGPQTQEGLRMGAYDPATKAKIGGPLTAPFESWIAFLVNGEMAAKQGDHWVITVYGKEFLAWIAQSGVGFFRPF